MITRVSRLLLLVSLALGSAGCDQWTKYQAVASLTDGLDRAPGASARITQYLWNAHPTPNATVTVVDGLWRFKYVENPGAAFSFLADAAFGRWLLVAIGLVAIAMFSAWALRLRRPLALVGASLIIGGAIGNLFDRIRLGYVVDFVQWHYHDRVSWPVFNVADAWILVGAVLLFGGRAHGRRAERASILPS
jgi:signal peptidase II